jgi:hypothetical protein
MIVNYELLVSDDGTQRVYRVYDCTGNKIGVRQEFIDKPDNFGKVRQPWLRVTPFKAGLFGAAFLEGARLLVDFLS